ncbi:MAG: SGNH/GDSL hydrolase family protein [Candidatus Dormibacteria bacterium]
MKARVRVALAITALLLSGCAGARSPAAVPAPLSRNTATPGLVYAAVGASETVGFGAAQPTSEAWPQVFYRTALPREAIFYNLGVPGDTVSAAQTDEVPPAFGVGANLVTVWLNVNDLLAGVSPEVYRAQLGKLVHDLRRGGAARVLVANTPHLEHLPAYLACHNDIEAPGQGRGSLVQPGSRPRITCPAPAVAALSADEVASLVDRYNEATADVVREEGAALVDLHAAGEISDQHPEYISADGFHPSTAGHAAIAAAFAEAYRKAIRA